MRVENNATFLEFDEALRTIEIVGSQRQMDVVMHIKSDRAGEIQGELEREFSDSKSRHEILGYFMSAGTPSDAGTGQATGRRRYSAVRIVRSTDGATASLMSSLSTNDKLTVELSSYKAGGDSSKDMQPKFKMLFEDARIKTFTLLNGGSIPNTGAMEIIELLFRKLTVESAPQTAKGQRGGVRTFLDTLSENP